MPTEPFVFCDSVSSIPKTDWKAITAHRPIYFSLAYLEALEISLPKTLRLIYTLVYKAENEPIAIGIFQIATFTYKKLAKAKLFSTIFKEHNFENGCLSINGLVCGNIFANGAHGLAFSEEISRSAATELIATAAKQLQENPKYEDAFSVMLFKEFDDNTLKHTVILEDFKYRTFQADVQMVLKMDAKWKSFDNYLQSMKAKYRTKANSALKKSDALRVTSLSEAEIKTFEESILKLYHNILDKSDYVYGENYPQAFANFKNKLGDKFICKGFFLNEKLVGFSTAFVNGNTLDANYVGLDYNFNTRYAVYERMLYDFVEEAITLKSKQLFLGRTSELIKSALGAVPQPMTLFIKHRSKLKNALLKPIIENITPSTYELRKPFKAKFYKEQ